LILAREAIVRFSEEEILKTEIQIPHLKAGQMILDHKDHTLLATTPLLPDRIHHHQTVVDHQEVILEEEDLLAALVAEDLLAEEVEDNCAQFLNV